MLWTAMTSEMLAAEANLIVDGTLESVTNLPSVEFRCSNDNSSGGRLELFSEDLSWNKCCKLVSGATHDEMAGGKMRKVTSAYLRIGGTKQTPGVPVTPGEYYEYSFDLKGSPKSAIFRIYEFFDKDGKEVRKSAFGDVHFKPGRKEWRRCKGSYRASPGAKRAELCVLLWSLVDDDEIAYVTFAPGDFVLVDNVSFVSSGRYAKMIAMMNSGETLRVAPIPVECDPATPFLPFELAEPPSKIVFRAAVNEKKPLPVAIGNLTGSFEQYRVVLETEPKKAPGGKFYLDNGEFGLEGFPKDKITVREALRFKSREEDPVLPRLDPLVGMNEASVISVPPKEAGAVWFDFDTCGVKPGIYRGRLRVIPLGCGAKYEYDFGKGRYFAKRSGEKIVPVEFTVDPVVLPRESVRPAHFCSPCQSAQGFALESDLGVRIYYIGAELVRPEAMGNPESAFRRTVRDHLDWAAARGVNISFFVKYDAFANSQKTFNPEKNPTKKWEAWERYVHTLAKLMDEAGVPFKDYYVLIRDEPFNSELEWVREAHVRMKRLYPQMQTYVSVCRRIFGKIDYLDFMGDTTDLWMMDSATFLDDEKTMDRLRQLKQTRGAKICHYRCSTVPGLSLVDYYRRHCWRGEFRGVDADMLYQFNIYNRGLRGEMGFKMAPAGEVSYKADGKFFPSVRYMAYREGVTDIKYVKVLRDMCAGDPDRAAQIDKMVRAVVRDDTASPESPAVQREKIRQMILEKLPAWQRD